MEFNVRKCKIMHIGPTKQHAVYTMGNHKLDKVEEEGPRGKYPQKLVFEPQLCQGGKKGTTDGKVRRST